MQHSNSQNYLEENLRAVTSIMVAQFLQKLTYEKVQTIVKELLDLAEKCKSLKPHESPSECCHQLMPTFLEHICNNQGLADRHVFSDCCNTNNSARHKCFLSYKKDVAGYSDIFQISNPEHICEMDKENHVPVKEKYIYETSRKHPFLYGPTILTMSACYETALEPIRKYIREISSRHHHLCEIGIKFNHKVAKAVELVLLTKKQPKANFSEIAKLAMDIKNLHQICCEGNTVACVLGRSQLMNYTCSKQATLSSKITPCCELQNHSEGNALSTQKMTNLISHPCHLAGLQKTSLFLYEYSRRHPELAVPVILRVDTVYQNLLGKCCKLENPLECYSHGEEMFQRVVHESHEHVKNQCDLHEKLGDSNFHDRYASKILSKFMVVLLYTKKAPQPSAQELVIFTKNMAAAATTCCPLNDEQQFVCMENSAKLILGALCRRHEAEPINAGVGHCCDDSYAFRKPCFDDLQVDGTYISPHLSCDQVVNLNEDLCRAQEEELKTEKQKLLSNLVKQEPYAAEMQFQSVIVDFAHLVEMCCQAEKSEMCLQE
ncbi:hypothetical protein EI555_014080, partial [Monodon monoceros]